MSNKKTLFEEILNTKKWKQHLKDHDINSFLDEMKIICNEYEGKIKSGQFSTHFLNYCIYNVKNIREKIQWIIDNPTQRLSLKAFICRLGEEEGQKKYDEYKNKIGVKLNSLIDRYGEEEGKRRYEEFKNKCGTGLKNFIRLYGEEEGKRRYDKKNEKCGTSLKNLIRLYGEEEGKRRYEEFKSKAGTSLEKFIERDGEELGRQKYSEYKSKLGTSLEKFIERDGEELGRQKYDELQEKIGTSLEKFIERDGEELGRQKYSEYKSKLGASISHFINRYGEELGRQKYEKFKNKCGASLKKFIERDGEELGRQKYENWLKKIGVGLNKMIERHGEELGRQYYIKRNEKIGTSLEKFIERDGEELGRQKFDAYVEKVKITEDKFILKYGQEEGKKRYEEFKSKCGTDLFNFVRLYGEEEGKKRYEEFKSKSGTTIEKFIERDGEELGRQKYDEYKRKCGPSLENLKRIYGEEKGEEKYFDIIKTRNKTMSGIFYDKIILNFKDYVIPLFTKNEYINFDKEYEWKCASCQQNFKSKVNTNPYINTFRYIPRCLNCYPITNISVFEKQVFDYCKSILPQDIDMNQQNRQLIKPYELDIVVPHLKIAIECNGLYWHSSQFGTKMNYHLNKTEECLKQGYKLIHIFEQEWNFKQNIIKSKLRSILGIYDKTIYARKCKIEEINNETKNDFLNNYHLQGQDNSSIKYGLFYDQELVAVMTFGKPRFNKNYDYELIRYATKYHIIGGAGKLLKHFERNYSGESIITYADRRFSQGNMYEKIGFKELKTSPPNYWWIKGDQTLTRYQCQKHKLNEILGNKFNNELTEYENMTLNGYFQIFDCGNLVYFKDSRS